MKAEEEQAARTKSKAEVFTPSWVVCYMNNKCDDDWFGRENVFNTLNGEHWEPTKEPVYFEKERDWQRYVDSRRLEITCGEAPYLVSRYDAATGEELPIESRIGILDRKLRSRIPRSGSNTSLKSRSTVWLRPKLFIALQPTIFLGSLRSITESSITFVCAMHCLMQRMGR